MKRWVGPVAIFFSVVCLLILCLYDMQKSSSPGEASQKHEEAGWSLAKQAVSHQEVNGTILSLRIQRQHLCLLRMEAKVTVSLESRR